MSSVGAAPSRPVSLENSKACRRGGATCSVIRGRSTPGGSGCWSNSVSLRLRSRTHGKRNCRAVLRLARTIPRCAAITRHPDRDDRARRSYAQIVREGLVGLGDAVRLDKPVIQAPGLQSRPSALTDGRIHPAVDERAGGVLETGRQALSYCIEPVLPVGRPREAALAVQFEQQPRGRPSPRPRPGDPAAGAQLVARARPARGPANRWPATV